MEPAHIFRCPRIRGIWELRQKLVVGLQIKLTTSLEIRERQICTLPVAACASQNPKYTRHFKCLKYMECSCLFVRAVRFEALHNS